MTTDVHRLTVVEDQSQSRIVWRRIRSVVAHALLIGASILMLYPLLWLLSAYALTDRLQAADEHSAEVRTQFLQNDQLLSEIRAQVLLSSVYLRWRSFPDFGGLTVGET